MLGYDETTWKHGDVITAAGLNKIEKALTELANNTFSNTAAYDITSTLPGENNKIATMESISATITSLTSTLAISNSAVPSEEKYRTVITSITETAGKLTSAEIITIPIASTEAFGLVKVGDNLTINTANNTLIGNYSIDNAGGNVPYNASSNKLATVATVQKCIGESIGTLTSVTGYNNEQLTITSITGNTTSGTISYGRQAISIKHDQINDITISSTTSSSTYEIPTTEKVNELITTKISQLDGSITGAVTAANTITSFSQTGGIISAKFEPIAINVSQVEGVATTATDGLMAAGDKTILDDLSINMNLLLTHLVITSGNITGIKVYNAAGTSYKVLTYDEITATAVSVGE